MSDRPTVSVSLTCKRADDALKFYKEAFGAQEDLVMPMEDGNLAHCEFFIGNTRIYLSCEDEDYFAKAMEPGQMCSAILSIEVDDCDAACEKARNAGARVLVEPKDQFYGARTAVLLDLFGYRWCLVQKTEELSNEEVISRAKALYSDMA